MEEGISASYQSLNEAATEAAHLLKVAVHIEDAVLLAQLDVGVDGDVDAGSAGAVAEIKEGKLRMVSLNFCRCEFCRCSRTEFGWKNKRGEGTFMIRKEVG